VLLKTPPLVNPFAEYRDISKPDLENEFYRTMLRNPSVKKTLLEMFKSEPFLVYLKCLLLVANGFVLTWDSLEKSKILDFLAEKVPYNDIEQTVVKADMRSRISMEVRRADDLSKLHESLTNIMIVAWNRVKKNLLEQKMFFLSMNRFQPDPPCGTIYTYLGVMNCFKKESENNKDNFLSSLIHTIASTNSNWWFKIFFQLLNDSDKMFQRIVHITMQQFMDSSKSSYPLLDALEAPCFQYVLESANDENRLKCLNSFEIISNTDDFTLCSCLVIMTGKKKEDIRQWAIGTFIHRDKENPW
jgi:hypothetical protein